MKANSPVVRLQKGRFAMSIIPFDYHVHSSISPDSKCPMEDSCRAAVENGLTELVFTEHLEFYSPGHTGYPFDAAYLDRYFETLEACRRQFAGALSLPSGIEIGQPTVNPEHVHQLLDGRSFDYRIGSVHKIQDKDLAFWDLPHADTHALCLEALQLTLDLAQSDWYDCLGHIDLIKRYGARQGIAISLEPYEDELAQICRTVIQKGKGIELNTSGLRQEAKETLPSLAILRLYRSLGGEIITMGSDSHRAADLAAGFETGRQLLLEAGFTHLCRFSQGKPQFLPL